MSGRPIVHVVVLSWNSHCWLERCLSSVLTTPHRDIRVSVVDNASSDGGPDYVRERFPAVDVIVNLSNLGFSEGNNVGIRRALAGDPDYVVLLNPDTWVEPEWLESILDVGERNRDVGILGPVQLDYEGCRFNSWTATALRQHLAELKDPAAARDWIPVEWVEGACMAVKRQVLDRVGLLDPIYYAFYEEVDLCRRAACCGFRTALVPRSRVHHYRGGSWGMNANVRMERRYRCERSQFVYQITDPRRSVAGNFARYLVTLGTKLKELLARPDTRGVWNLVRVQAALVLDTPELLGKWRRDRAGR